MAYDVSTYEPGAGYDENPDGGQNPGGEQPAPVAAAPAPAPAAAGYEARRFDHMRKQAEARAGAAAAGGTPAAATAAATEEQPPAGDAPHELHVPDFVSAKEVTPEREAYVAGFAALAPQAGIDSATAQGVLDVAVDAAVALTYSIDLGHATPVDAQAEMDRLYGDKVAAGLITSARSYVKARPALREYLDSTGLGNDPAVLTALAFASTGLLASTPAQAKDSIAKLMATPEYAKGDKLTLVKVQALSRIAHRGQDENSQLAAAARAQAAKTAAAPVPAAAGSDVRAEITKLLDPKGALLHGGPGQAEARARYLELIKKI